MRRVLVALNKLNDLTGSETYCLGLVKHLVASGSAVELFTLYSSAWMEERVRSLGGRLYTYPDFPTTAPDRLLTMHPLATSLALRRVPRDVPTLAVIHGVTPGEMPVRTDRIDRFVAVSAFVAAKLVARDRIAPDEIAVIRNGIDLHEFDAPRIDQEPSLVRALWASTTVRSRRPALTALAAAVERSEHVHLTIVEDNLPRALVPAGDRIDVVAKTRDVRDLIRRSDVVCGVGVGRILLEALAMNRAALSLNVHGKAEFLADGNSEKLEFYCDEWGADAATLLTPSAVFRGQNRRSLAAKEYDMDVNLRRLERELETLRKRERGHLAFSAREAARLAFVAAAYAALARRRIPGIRGFRSPRPPERPRSLSARG